ncbi:uracil-DNA glycosylase [Nocardia mangyaensis]|uniref:uracil-DNA glycosylase n=1 Tax=Nocardia mangyaensis TaxID=2213200 RepID=UPI00267577DA|nr:uracil-DNA glycosylase [Nocardia mangyaensis]MDO3650915.1 uracil-DNA glycosylase [Nocardia mangyaensis]
MTVYGRNVYPDVLADKRARVRAPHVRPLNELADRIAVAEGIPVGFVPYVDPDIGGIHARALVLLDNPSTKAEAARNGGSGFLSLDNNDATARNCREAYLAHGIEWSSIVHWNVCPFPTGRENGASLASERDRGARWTREFVEMCPNLEIVLCLGRAAEDGWRRAGIRRTDLYLFPQGVPHCSQRGLASKAARQRFNETIAQLAGMLRAG